MEGFVGVKIIAFREDGWMPPNTDWRMWDHLCRAYDVDVQLIDEWSEAVVPEGYAVVAFDQDGTDEVGAYTPPGDVAYVFGHTGQNLVVALEGVLTDAVRIDTPSDVSLFPVCAAAIALYALYG